MHKSRTILPSQSARLTPFAESQKLIMQSSVDQAGDAFMGCFRIKHIFHSGLEDHRVLEALGVSNICVILLISKASSRACMLSADVTSRYIAEFHPLSENRQDGF